MSDTLTTPKIPVTLTPTAVTRIKMLIEKQGKSDLHLRLGVKGGGCSGLSYTMTLDNKKRDGDFVYTQDEITLVVDQRSAQYLDGVELDFTLGNLLEGGWKWTNPHALRSCGCGTSFTPDK